LDINNQPSYCTTSLMLTLVFYIFSIFGSDSSHAENANANKDFRYYCEHVANLKREDGACQWVMQVFLKLNNREKEAGNTIWGTNFPAIIVSELFEKHLKSLELEQVGVLDFNEFACILAIGKLDNRYKRIDFVLFKNREDYSVKVGGNMVVPLYKFPEKKDLVKMHTRDLTNQCDFFIFE